MTVLHMLSAGAAKGLVLAMQARFPAARHVEFENTFGAVGAIKEKLLGEVRMQLFLRLQSGLFPCNQQ